MTQDPLVQMPQWLALEEAALQYLPPPAGRASAYAMRSRFSSDPGRFERFSMDAGPLFLDFSKQLLDDEVWSKLVALAKARGLGPAVDRLFGGERVNITENRAALHAALRAGPGSGFAAAGEPVEAQVNDALSRLAEVTRSVRDGEWKGDTGKAITDVVNIGIGGSDLGPTLLCEALQGTNGTPIRAHFVSNLDGTSLNRCLAVLNPETTLFVVVSKSFTTAETLTNALSARAWLLATLGKDAALGRHFLTVSAHTRPDARFGAPEGGGLLFWDWVGGRYSVWSTASAAAVMALGMDVFEAFLEGARAMDGHFRSEPMASNGPVMAALVGIWNTNFLGCQTQAIVPYDERLSRLPAYLQQLEMESNGKSVGVDGQRVGCQTAPVIWGDRGTNGQHAFFQQLHQGPAMSPVDFILAASGADGIEAVDSDGHHRALVANCLAQSRALMAGRTPDESASTGADPALVPHRTFSGDRPSTTILMQRLDPYSLGALIAFYEHKVFVQAQVWGINPFDQWGVELGKELAGGLDTVLDEVNGLPPDLDASTAGLVMKLRALRAKV